MFTTYYILLLQWYFMLIGIGRGRRQSYESTTKLAAGCLPPAPPLNGGGTVVFAVHHRM